jgi:hypothetical protein
MRRLIWLWMSLAECTSLLGETPAQRVSGALLLLLSALLGAWSMSVGP